MNKEKNEDLANVVYLDTACLGIVSNEVIDEMRTFLSDLKNITKPATQMTLDMYDYLPKAREAAAKLTGVSPEEMALVESTSHGLGLVAESLPIERKNNILICDLEFLSCVMCWRVRQEKIGFELRRVPSKNGEVRSHDFEAAIDNNTKAIVVSSVQEVNGYRVDIKELSELARMYDCYLIVDGIQEVGVLDVRLKDLGVDVYCAGGHKWLRNPFGTGFIYMNKSILEDLNPSFYGYFNTEEPEGGWQDYLESAKRTPFDRLKITDRAMKFEIGGTPNFLGALGLYKNIELILEDGINKIERKVVDLNDRLINGLNDLKLNIVSSSQPQNRSGITTFSMPGGLEQERRLNEELERHRIFVSIRYVSGVGGMRVSPHCYNSFEDIDLLLEMIEGFLRNE